MLCARFPILRSSDFSVKVVRHRKRLWKAVEKYCYLLLAAEPWNIPTSRAKGAREMGHPAKGIPQQPAQIGGDQDYSGPGKETNRSRKGLRRGLVVA
jgi:hypothetical protein